MSSLAEAQEQMRQRQFAVQQELRPAYRRPQLNQSSGIRPYSIDELVELHGFSRRTVIRLYENEQGVQTFVRPEGMHKRRYRTIRVPHHVYERVRLKLEGVIQ